MRYLFNSLSILLRADECSHNDIALIILTTSVTINVG